MKTFHLISLATGAHTGKTIRSSSMECAENTLLEKGYDMYDGHMLTAEGPGKEPYTDKQINYLSA